jgi:hypothetical protein
MAKLRRKIQTRSAALMLICCEGAKTEIQYFEEWEKQFPRVKVNVFSPPKDASAPSRLADTIKKSMRAQRFQTGDQAWLVLDQDQWPGKQLAILHQQVKSAKLLEARSNPSFEIWLLAHFEDIGTALRADEIVQRLRQHLGSYNKKNNLDMIKFLPCVESAIANAQRADINKHVTPGATRVFLLMQAIAALIAPARLTDRW